jgi:hypothetical protein
MHVNLLIDYYYYSLFARPIDRLSAASNYSILRLLYTVLRDIARLSQHFNYRVWTKTKKNVSAVC